mmetsp:Transcript_8639/g.10918  ORF Transcript_8639/g.10918 Transcript_8639/m.10918 type:complete len:91 (+) Transcript_8639:166-438(+)
MVVKEPTLVLCVLILEAVTKAHKDQRIFAKFMVAAKDASIGIVQNLHRALQNFVSGTEEVEGASFLGVPSLPKAKLKNAKPMEVASVVTY